MTKYKITAPEPRFSGDVAGLVFRAGEANAQTPADLAAVAYCQRRGYTVVAVDNDGEPLPVDEQPGGDTPDPEVTALVNQQAGSDGETAEAKRPANSAPKGDWVAYAVHRGASEDDAKSATKDDLIELYG